VGYYASFSGSGQSLRYPDVFIDKYYEYLEGNHRPLGNLMYEQLSTHRLKLTDDEGKVRRNYAIVNCFIFDTALDSATESFHLSEGNWYKVENSYIARIRTSLDPLCFDLNLPPYKHESESHYNKGVAAGDDAFVCLDESNVGPRGQTAIEPCDLYSADGDCAVFHHVKRSTVSAKLSHLFNQGVNAIELIRLEPACYQKLRGLILEKASSRAGGALLGALDGQKFRVVFGIVTHKDKANKSKNLPLFSRISLMRTARTLKLESTECRYGFIHDQSPPMVGVKKTRKPRTKKAA
jgi:uncharacterized protein (TIGR04141 family)